jgi:signal transduction histidine kinase/ActR/RegA family two-component response regulator
MLGLEVPALVGEDADALLSGALVPFLPALLEVERTHQPFAFEISVAGGSRALRLSAFSPNAGHVAALIEDLTERRRAEAAQRQLQEHLAQAQKMELVGRLAGGVAHDFNNILTVILSYARALTDELRGEQREFAQEIGSAGQRASALTRQLLAFSRKQVLCPEVLAVGEVVTNLAKMIGRLIGEDIELKLAVAPGVGHILMDPAQLEQALVNLAVNARDAMPDGGRLTIAVCDADVSAADAHPPGGIPEGSYVTITVADTGTGMDAATLAHLYEPFFTTKPKGKGTGLGLSMVLGAVEQSGGTLRVASAPGAGTTFTLHLPRVAAAGAPAAFGTSGAPRGAGERILVVEDEQQVRGAVRLFLVSAGYEVVEAACGDDGLAAFRADPDGIDLVLTDLVMPGMSGSTLGRAVRAQRPVTVLYMSGYSEEIASGREAVPPQLLLLKPFEREALLARVHTALHAPSVAAGGIPALDPPARADASSARPRS